MADTLIVSGLALSFVFGWNNSSFLIGNMRGSGVLSLKGAVAATVVGMLLGVLAEGPKMLKSLDGSLALSVPSSGLLLTLVLSAALMLALTVAKLPASLSSAMVGAFLGVALGVGASVRLPQVELVVSFWFVAPVLAGVVAYLLHKGMSRVVPRLSIVASDTFNRLGVVAGSLLVAYSLGANNLGLITGTSAAGEGGAGLALLSAAMTGVALLGVVALGKGNVAGTMGDKMLSLSPQGVLAVFSASALLVWVGTQLAVPMSISQCVLGGMIGAAVSQRTAVINARLAYETIGTWVVVPAVAFLVGYALAVA